MKVSVVIARFNEDLSWLSIFDKIAEEMNCKIELYIYNKGIDNLDLPCEKIDNLGREAYTYLYHILNRMKNPQDIKNTEYTLFLQGRIDDHCIDLKSFIKNKISDAMTHSTKLSLTSAASHNYLHYSAHPNFRIFDWKGQTTRAEVALGPWFENNLKIKFPDQPLWWSGALFCINDILILNRKVTFYEQLLLQVSTLNPEVAHYLERSWLYVFLPDIING
jgi:hypothetical protein